MKTVVGLFERFEDAGQAVRNLAESGVRADEMSLLARQASVEKKVGEEERLPDQETGALERPRPSASEVAESAGKGILGGGLAGGLLGMLVGLGAITIPGLGAAFAAGALATTIGATAAGASIGATTGGIIGAMLKLGVPDEEAELYAEGVKRGAILLAVQTDDARAEQIWQVMNEANAQDIDALRRRWNQEGWQRFEEGE